MSHQTNKANTRRIYLFFAILIVFMIGGVILYGAIQSKNDKAYYESHEVGFSVIEHDEIKETHLYASVRRVNTALDNIRNQYQVNASGVSLKELHLYANHESFIKYTERAPDVAAFFNRQGGIPSIHLPADIYLIKPETIPHEVMHSFIYEILGESNREIPLWFHDGYAQYSSMNWSDLIDERVRTKLFLWENKPEALQIPGFILYSYQYPSDSILKGLFYDASFAFVDFLESRTRDNLFKQIMFDLSKSNRKSFDAVISERLGVSLDSLYSSWLKQSTGLDIGN